LTGIVKVDVDYEVRWNDFTLILSNVLRTQLHFTSFDVVSSLNESCVEHDAEHCLVGEACVAEYYLDVSLQQQALLLLFCQ
jgi:hypothetical protein